MEKVSTRVAEVENKVVEPEKRGPKYSGIYKFSGQRCIGCGSYDVRTVRTVNIEKTVKRDHICKKCGAQFSTIQDVPVIDLDAATE